MIGDLDADAGKACLAEWNAGRRADFLTTDVSREASVRRFVQHALNRFGGISGLVNNAGLADPEAGAEGVHGGPAGTDSVCVCEYPAAS